MSARAVVHYELTALGRAALEEDAEDSALCCAWCEEPVLEGEAVVPAGAGRLIHDTPSCRGEFERFTAGDSAEAHRHAEP